MLRNSLLLVLLLLTAERAFAADGNIKMDTHVFFISFLDTSFIFKASLHLDYNDTGKHKIATISVPTDDLLKKKTVILNDTLSFQDFKSQINQIALNEIGHILSENSLWEIYYWMFTQIYGNSTAPLSGKLHFASNVQYFDSNVDDKDDDSKIGSYQKRIKETDSLIGKQIYYAQMVVKLTDEQTQNIDSMSKFDTTSKAKTYELIIDS